MAGESGPAYGDNPNRVSARRQSLGPEPRDGGPGRPGSRRGARRTPIRFAATLACGLGLGALTVGCAQTAAEGTVKRTAEAFAARDGQQACAHLTDEAKRDLARFRPRPTTCEAVVGSLDPASVAACREAQVSEVRVLSSEEAWARVKLPRGDTQVWLSKLLDKDWLLRTPPCGPGSHR
jgi:hypothetical protein